MIRFSLWIVASLVVLLTWHISIPQAIASDAKRPNVILVMIDDMGFGDLSCHGSPHINTPNLDALYRTSVRLTDFHVAPMCSPTRGQLMTGVDAMRNGSTLVASSRMMVRESIPMLPQHLAANGYSTGMFGKWHLGENAPHRPEDRGFQTAMWFPMQEIGSISDAWCNDYFDGVFRHADGTSQRSKGYCVDVLFDNAIRWIESQRSLGQPFFCYLPMNVVHGPQWAVPERRQAIAKQFPELSAGEIGYLAMLNHFDDAMGKLENYLIASGQHNNTLIIFLSDNGGYALVGKYNAGMRGGKSRLYEGGHRVPCFLRWPDGNIGGLDGGKDLSGLTQVQDLCPTILSLTNSSPINDTVVDGIDLSRALRGAETVPDRTLIVQYGLPEAFRMTCVMQGPWRLLSDIKGTAKGDLELYRVDRDPMQESNLIHVEKEKAAELQQAYDRWWQANEPTTHQRAKIHIGSPTQSIVQLTCAEWRENALSSVEKMRQGVKRRGMWDLEVQTEGLYRVKLRRWPHDSGLKLTEAALAWAPRDMETPDHIGYGPGIGLPISTSELRLGEHKESVVIDPEMDHAEFILRLERGATTLEGLFYNAKNQILCGAFYATVEFLKAMDP